MNWKSIKFPVAIFASLISLGAQVPVTPSINVPNTGQVITPLAAHGSRFTYLNPGLANHPNDVVEFAVSSALSPDGKTLALITSGDYGIYTTTGSKDTSASTEWLFIFDISHGLPVQKQAIQVLNTYQGVVFDPSGTALYVSGGRNDSVHIYTLAGGVWAESASSPVALGHSAGLGTNTPSEAAGLAVSSDGTKLVVANYENDSVTVLTNSGGNWSIASELDLRPATVSLHPNGTFGGEYPFWVSIAHNNTAFVSSMRDREVVAVDISNPAAPTVVARITTTGQPLKSTLDVAQNNLYVAEDQSDMVGVINTSSFALIAEQKVVGPASIYPAALANLSGNNTNSVTLSPDGTTLYVTNGTTNNVAVVSVATLLANNANPVEGLIPTGQYPSQVLVTGSGVGQFMYVLNAKGPSGPNADHCHGSLTYTSSGPTTATCNASNQYSLQLTKAGLQFLLVPAASSLPALSAQVAANNNLNFTESSSTAATMKFLAQNIKHVIYIVRENRTYDQILGDLGKGNGDPSLVEFGANYTPNIHTIANNFVDLDNFYDTAEVSYDGWSWSTSAMAPDIVIRQTAVNYCFRAGVAYESEGDLRGVNLNYRPPTLAANVLPGVIDTDAPDGPGNQLNSGYLWSTALRSGLSVREYGADGDSVGSAIPWPASIGVQQTNPSFAVLNNSTNYDVDFRSYDLVENDTYRYKEWNYDVFTRLGGNLPALSILRFPKDHTGSYSTNPNTVNYAPESEVADNDFAVGSVIQDIANSQYKDNTLIFVIEDDAQNGGDHVDAHRSVAFIVGPYVKQGAVVSTQYNTINFIRTMERVLGLQPNHITDALAQPMADVFDTTQNPNNWSFTATAAPILYGTELLPLLPAASTGMVIPKPTHGGNYWARVTKGMDFTKADNVDPAAYNRILWRGLKGDVTYPGDSNVSETRRRYKDIQKKGAANTDDAGE